MRALLARTLILAAALAATLSGQQQAQPPAQPPQQPQPPRPTFRADINFVRVDVIVADDKGTPILDLKQEDFSVSEDGKPQKVETFSVVKIDPLDQVEGPTNGEIRTVQDEEREAARPEVRLFVIYLDDYHVSRGNDMAVRKPLIDFIENQLAPADMVAVMYPMTPVNDIQFTRSRSRLISAINNFEGRKFNYQPRNAFEEQYIYYPAAAVERIRNQVTLSGLEAAAIRMGGLREGRKSIILVSEGLISALPPQMNDPVAAFPGMNNPSRGNQGAQLDDRSKFMAQIDLNAEMQRTFDVINRQNASIYAVDPRGLAVFEYGIQYGVGLQQDSSDLRSAIDTLHVLSNNTDGRAIVNRNDLAAGMKQIMRDSSGYYLLGYTSTKAPIDGKFHEIKVHVKRRGVNVRARKGYWAYTKEDVERASAPKKPEAPPEITRALTALATPPRGHAARFWIGTARGDKGMGKVTVAWEPVESAPDTRRETAARVALTVIAPDGRPLFRGKFPEQLSTSEAAPAPGAAARGGSVTFDAPPGAIQMRMMIEGAKGEVLDSLTQEFTVPDFTQVGVAMGTPRFYRGRSVRELQLLRANPAAVPSVDREFSRSDRILLRVEAYAPGGVVPGVTARLLNRTGGLMSELPMQANGGVFEAELPLSSFGAGDYLIEITAKAESGEAKETLAFRIGR